MMLINVEKPRTCDVGFGGTSTQVQGRCWWHACPLAGPPQAEVHMAQDPRGMCTAVLSPDSGRG